MTNKDIQNKLNKLNAGLKVDGIFGTKTNKYFLNIDNKKSISTAHFHQSEFNCHCCGQNIGIDINLIVFLEAIRYQYKRAIAITSGYRCPKHNKEVGGGSKSQHLYGRAGDFVVSSISASTVRKLCEKYNQNGGVGSPDYKNFTHADCRGYKARW